MPRKEPNRIPAVRGSEVVELKTGHTKATYETDGQGDVKSQAFL